MRRRAQLTLADGVHGPLPLDAHRPREGRPGGFVTKFPFIEKAPEGVYIRLRIQPRASRDRVDGIHGGALKLRLTAPPVEGEANLAVIKFLSKSLKIPKSSITIESGLKSRDKRVLIEGAAIAEIERALEAVLSP